MSAIKKKNKKSPADANGHKWLVTQDLIRQPRRHY